MDGKNEKIIYVQNWIFFRFHASFHLLHKSIMPWDTQRAFHYISGISLHVKNMQIL
jgi:hypothetical protein